MLGVELRLASAARPDPYQSKKGRKKVLTVHEKLRSRANRNLRFIHRALCHNRARFPVETEPTFLPFERRTKVETGGLILLSVGCFGPWPGLPFENERYNATTLINTGDPPFCVALHALCVADGKRQFSPVFKRLVAV
jgi:hypothetical protein